MPAVKQIFSSTELPTIGRVEENGLIIEDATLTIDRWSKTLTEDEQASYAAAVADLESKKQAQVDAGHMTIEDVLNDQGLKTSENYIWSSEDVKLANEHELISDSWFEFYERWLTATGVSITKEEVTV